MGQVNEPTSREHRRLTHIRVPDSCGIQPCVVYVAHMAQLHYIDGRRADPRMRAAATRLALRRHEPARRTCVPAAPALRLRRRRAYRAGRCFVPGPRSSRQHRRGRISSSGSLPNRNPRRGSQSARSPCRRRHADGPDAARGCLLHRSSRLHSRRPTDLPPPAPSARARRARLA